MGSYLVEITGEMKAVGLKPDGAPWRIAIEAPLEGERQAQRIVQLNGLALSTSGDYRNWHEVDGQRQRHIMDPRTLAPVRHRLPSHAKVMKIPRLKPSNTVFIAVDRKSVV